MKEIDTAEVFPTLRNISLSRRTFVACAAIAAAQAALVSAGCAPEVQSSGEGLASTAAFAPGTYTASAPGKKGPVTVEVRMSESAIESVEIVEFEDTERISAPARERVPQQIVELQSLNVDAVTGATLTSMAIIESVADCVNQANGDASALKKAASPEKSDETKEIQADLVVCGAGGAGMAAAVAAAQQGLDVVVFEKTAYAGGNALVSGGWLEVFEGVDDMKPDMTDGNRDMFHATLQKSLDNGVPKDFVDAVQADFDAYFAAGNTKVYDSMEYYALDYASRNGGPAKEYWLPYAHKVNDLNNWLFDQGYTVSGTLVGIVGFPWPRKAHAVDKENGEGFFSVFDNTVETQSLPITFLFETPVSELIVDGKAVVGASGQCADGTTYRVMADRGVILATGGYSGNPDLLKKYNEMWPWDESTVIPTTNSYGHTGDGHVLAEGLGAELKNMGRQMVFPIADSIDYSTETIVGNAGLGLFVNVNGERFINESLDRFALSAAVMKQPEEKLFIISDALNSGLVNGYNEQGYSADKLIEESKLFRADSLEELAQMIGADPSVLAKAVDDYNAIACGDVADTVFGRENMSEKDAIVEAPFYASPRTWAAHVTIGGVAIGPDYQALTADGTGIEGLYVVGECSDGNSGVSSMSTGLSCVNQMLA